jgi:hypothetical protein
VVTFVKSLFSSCDKNDSSLSSLDELRFELRRQRAADRFELEEILRRCQNDPWFVRDYCKRGNKSAAACRKDNNGTAPVKGYSSETFAFLKSADSADRRSSYRQG